MRRILHNFRRGNAEDAGSSMVEFALSATIFLFLIFATIDFAYMFFVKVQLQNAVLQAGRYAITGQAHNNESRYSSILQTVEDLSMGRANSGNTTVCSSIGGCGSAGGPGDVVTITITYNYELLTPFVATFFPNGRYLITVTSSFTNEGFPPGQS